MGQLFNDRTLDEKEMKLFDFIQKHCIYRVNTRLNEPRILRLSRTGPVQDGRSQFYMMRALMDADMVSCIGPLFWEKVYDVWEETEFQVAGVESSGIPLVSAITSTAWWLNSSEFRRRGPRPWRVNGFVVRKEKKKYGLCNWTEGIIKPNVPVIVVDDVSNSKGQMSRACSILNELGCEVYPLGFSIVNFQHHSRRLPHEVRTLFDRDNFSLRHGEQWISGSYDRSTDLEIDFSPEPMLEKSDG